MHTATQLQESMFSIAIAGEESLSDALLPSWQLWDRFGIVVSEPFGALGASLLLQAAITAYHDVRRAQGLAPAYPECYVFHFGGRWGNHSPFDIWPNRKEVFVEGGHFELLMAINDRAITRLATPLGARRTAEDEWPDNGMEFAIAKERIKSVFGYAADGMVGSGDVGISSLSSTTEQNVAWTLRPQVVLAEFEELAPTDLFVRQWLSVTRDRINEVPRSVHAAIDARRNEGIEDGGIKERYLRMTLEDAYRRLAMPA